MAVLKNIVISSSICSSLFQNLIFFVKIVCEVEKLFYLHPFSMDYFGCLYLDN